MLKREKEALRICFLIWEKCPTYLDWQKMILPNQQIDLSQLGYARIFPKLNDCDKSDWRWLFYKKKSSN